MKRNQKLSYRDIHDVLDPMIQQASRELRGQTLLSQKFQEWTTRAVESPDHFQFSLEEDQQIRDMGVLEKTGDFHFMIPEHWNRLQSVYLPKITGFSNLQDLLVSRLSPVIQTVAQWQRSRLLEIEDQIWLFLPEDIAVFELYDGKRYELRVVSSQVGKYEWMAHQKFKALQKDFRDHCIRKIGVENGQLIISKIQTEDDILTREQD